MKHIVWFDVETTGLDIVNDRIVEICLVKTDYELNVIETFYSLIKPPLDTVWSENAIEKHKITPDAVKNSPAWEDIAKDIFNFIGDNDLGGYNILKFDIPMISEEFLRCKIAFNFKKLNIIDPYILYNKMEKRDLVSAYKKFTGNDLENAHKATDDIHATIDIFKAQKELWNLGDIESVNEIIQGDLDYVDPQGKLKYVKIEGGKNVVVFNFGKYKDKSVQYVLENDPKYIDWLCNAQSTSRYLRLILLHYKKV